MTSSVDSTQTQLMKSSLFGVLRGLCVHTLIYPFEVLKIQKQCAETSEKSIRIALTLFRQEGFHAFYKGLSAQLLKTSLKQIWCWPMITGVPVFLQPYQLHDVSRQALTGLAIATIDAIITTPLEKAKIVSISTERFTFSLRNAYKDGWRGVITHWSKLSVNWMTFLIAQKYLRDRAFTESQAPLSLLQLMKIGTQVALIVSLVSAPFDIANTLKLAQNLNISHFFSRNGIAKLYRGWPLYALSLAIHNIASVIVIDALDTSVSKK